MDEKYAATGIFGPAATPAPEPPAPTLDYSLLLGPAVEFAQERLGGLIDRGGQPQVGHSLRVMAFGAPDPFGMIVRVLHDTVEDSDTSLAEIAERFGQDVAEVVNALTHRKGEETYRQYIERCYRTEAARAPKRDDIRDNSDPRRITHGAMTGEGGQTLADWHEAMVRTRYVPALHYLAHGEWPEK